LAIITGGNNFALNIDTLDVRNLLSGTISIANSSQIRVDLGGGDRDDFFGSFVYDAAASLAGGTLNEILETRLGVLAFDVKNLSVSVTAFVSWVAAGDTITAKNTILAGNDTFFGTIFDDVLRGFGGNDTFHSSPGFDVIDGGSGVNSVAYTGTFANYTLAPNANGTWSIHDNRASAPDGNETLSSIQQLVFTDQTVALGAVPSAGTLQQVQTEFAQVFRASATSIAAATPSIQLSDGTTVWNPLYLAAKTVLPLASQLQSGMVTSAQAANVIAHAAAATTSVATLAYEFFTGKAPSAAGMDYLVSPTGPNPNNLNAAYYQSFSLENRYINFAVNLGKVGEGSAAFTATYGSETLFAATRDAYTKIFGGTPSDTKLHALLDPTFVLNGQTLSRADYFAFYGGDGPNGIGTKAAMVGWLLSEAVKADLGTYAHANDAFLADVALHNAPFGVDLVGLYAKPSDVFLPG
jgi:RsaA N-terminal domain/RTX calcium-binding nonapeptide repeat (4 copies)